MGGRDDGGGDTMGIIGTIRAVGTVGTMGAMNAVGATGAMGAMGTIGTTGAVGTMGLGMAGVGCPLTGPAVSGCLPMLRTDGLGGDIRLGEL